MLEPYRNSAEEIEEMVRKAFEIDYNVREDIIKHSWSDYGKKIYDIFLELK